MVTTKNRVVFSRRDWEEMRQESQMKESIENIEDREELRQAIKETEYFVDYEEYSKKRRENNICTN